MKKGSRILLLLAVILFCAVVFPVDAQAAVVASGECGENVTWTLDDAGTLTISGTGPMWDGSAQDAAWAGNDVKKVIIEDGVTTIGSCAFSECYDLKNIVIPDSMTAIHEGAFNHCESLTSITIPASVTTIDYGAFREGCYNLTEIKVSEDNPVYSSDKKGVLYNDVKAELIAAPPALAGSYTIRDNIKRIGDSAFYECAGLTSVVIPTSVTTIGEDAFVGTGLTSIAIPNSVTTIGEGAFIGTNLTSVVIPNSVTTIGYGAFHGCERLESVKLPDRIKNIAGRTFAYCENLKSISIPSGVTTIEDGAFHGCERLESIELPNGLKAIADETFWGCKGLKSVKIPESVTRIAMDAFYGCTSLKDVYYAGSPKQWAKVNIDEEGNEPLLNAKITFGKCDHNYNSGVVTKKATCKEEGVKTFTCSICKGTRTEKIAKLTTHSYDGGVVTTEPTCKEEGVKTFTCTVCAKSYTEKIEKLTEHSYDDGVITTPPTCKETGIMTFTCTICEDSFTEDAPKLTTHTYDEGVVTKASTCKEEGIKTFTCTVCDVKKTEPIEKTDVHTYAGGVCAICGSSDPNYAPIVDEPEPDDPVNDTQKIVVIAVVAVSIVLIGAVCLFFFFSRDKGSDDSHS